MLNPPLSVLSYDLLGCIVEHIAMLPSRDKQLRNLSLADRAFTHLCQTYIFQILTFEEPNRRISSKLEKIGNILKDNPLPANSVRIMRLVLNHQNVWLFDDPTFINIVKLLAKSPRPPHELHFGGLVTSVLEDPILIVDRLAQSFFPLTLTTLTLTYYKNIPLSFFVVCPRLKTVKLDHVSPTKHEYPDELCVGRDPPALEVFEYRSAHRLVKQMITPPPMFHTPVVLWSNLRVLTLSPHEKKEMACLQSILDAACNTLEELFLTSLRVADFYGHLPLAALVNLGDLSYLRVFALYTIIKCHARGATVLRDVNNVLGTIAAPNRITNLFFDFTIDGKHPFRECLDQDWVGLCDQVIRISDEKPLELDLQTCVETKNFLMDTPGEYVLYPRIIEKATPLSEYPKICTHFWNPSYWGLGCAPFPRNQNILALMTGWKRLNDRNFDIEDTINNRTGSTSGIGRREDIQGALLTLLLWHEHTRRISSHCTSL